MYDVGGGAGSDGLHLDAIQLEAGLGQIWDMRGEGRTEGDDSATHHGHLDSYGRREVVTGAKNESAVLAALPQGKTNGRHQGEGVHQQGTPTRIHPMRGRGVTYCVDGIDVHYCSYSCQGKKEGEVLRRTQRIREY